MMMKKRQALAALGTLAAGALLPSMTMAAEAAAAYPSRIVKIVVPLSAGGGVDAIARKVGEKTAPILGKQPLIVDNKPGASGTLGVDAAAKAQPDGYTLVLTAGSTIAVNPHVLKRIPYDTDKDITPVVQIGTTPLVLLVNANNPAKDLKEFIANAKAKPKDANFGSYGNATVGHLLGEALNKAASIQMAHIPYKGSAPAITDLIGGNVQAVIADFGSARAQMSAGGKLRALAVSGAKRQSSFPNVPTFTEQGYASLEGMGGWLGVFAPSKTPKDIVDKIAGAMSQALKSDDLKAAMSELGYEATGTPTDKFAVIVKQDTERWGAVIKSIGGITLD
jgi:tripartite-type tricarboxylate transporter receptor subunit TctC